MMIVLSGGGSFCMTVESSGFVVSTRILRPSTPTDPTMSARVVIIDVAIPFNVATLTRETNFPVTGDVLGDNSIVCSAGPTSFMGAGIASVIPKI